MFDLTKLFTILQMIGHLNGFNLHIREPKRENLNGLPENSTETLIKIRYVLLKKFLILRFY